MHLVRRAKSLAATCIDVVAGPLGWDVYVTATHGLPGVDALTLRRRPPGQARPRRLRARAVGRF